MGPIGNVDWLLVSTATAEPLSLQRGKYQGWDEAEESTELG